MKKLILTLFIGFSTLLTAAAQDVKIGIVGGLNRSSIWDNWPNSAEDHVSESLQFKTGLNTGVVFDILLNRRFTFQPGLLYSQKGFNFKSNRSSDSYSRSFSVRITSNYLDFPAYIKYKVTNKKSCPYLIGGPGLGMLLHASSYQITSTTDYSGNVTSSYRGKMSDWRRFEAHASLGAGIEKNIGKHQLAFESRYTVGLTDLWRKSVSPYYLYNHYLSVQAIYFIPTSLNKLKRKI